MTDTTPLVHEVVHAAGARRGAPSSSQHKAYRPYAPQSGHSWCTRNGRNVQMHREMLVHTPSDLRWCTPPTTWWRYVHHPAAIRSRADSRARPTHGPSQHPLTHRRGLA